MLPGPARTTDSNVHFSRLPRALRHATTAGVTTQPVVIKGAEAAQQAARDWQAVHGDPAIQYAPLPVPPEPVKPDWIKWLEELFKPIGELLGASWQTLQWILLGVAVLAVLWAAWRLAEPLLEGRRKRAEGEAEAEWVPDRDAALALLEDADRLASEGRFDEATHLLLRRSVAQIADARPDWVHPASTAREIAGIALLPVAAREAFATIAARVERSLFALRSLDASDWQAAREAYARFALERLAA